MDPVKTIKDVNTDKAWQIVHQRLLNDGLIPEKTTVVWTGSRPQWVLYAATLLVIIAIGTISYLLIPRNSAPQLVTLQTGGDNTTYVQTFADGSVVYMADNTFINYPQDFSGGKRSISLSGEAFFDIVPSDQPFVIETQNAIIEVLGTSFNIKSSVDDLELIVEEGVVRVTLKKFPGQNELVGRWEMVTYSGNHMEKLPVIDPAYLSWRTNRMQFRDERLDNIVAVISKNFDVEIRFENDIFRERRMSVTFDNSGINTIARVIAFMQDLDYEIDPESGIFFREKR